MILRSITDIGVKRKDNQDNYWCARLESNGSEIGVACMCDGMGGLMDGGKASRMVVAAVREYMMNSTDMKGLDWVIRDVNKQIIELSRDKGKIGTTCTIIKCNDGHYDIFHIGDSRCYLLDSSGNLKLLTKDHTVVQKYKDQGRTLPPELVKKYKNTLTRCVGVSEAMVVDKVSGTYGYGDSFLVCSDGFWHNFAKGVKVNKDYIKELRSVVDRCIKLGETDNITAMTIDIC